MVLQAGQQNKVRATLLHCHKSALDRTTTQLLVIAGRTYSDVILLVSGLDVRSAVVQQWTHLTLCP